MRIPTARPIAVVIASDHVTFTVMEHLTAGDLDERFEFGLDVLVRGLAATAVESVLGAADPG